jgi:dienelactone hydrolase
VPAIFVAPQSDGDRWQEKDHAPFDDILAFVKENLRIDTSRVFATGFSFGGMVTYSLSVHHQSDIRAAVGIAPANYNIFVPPATHEPIAWMQTTGIGGGHTNIDDESGTNWIATESWDFFMQF